MDKFTFMKRAFAWTAIVSAIAFIIVGFVAPIEAEMSVFGHWLKVFFGWVFVTVILEVFMFTIGQVAYHWKDDYRKKYGEHWFREGVKEDIAYIKSQITGKKVLKVIGIYVGFFAACLLIFDLLELLVP